MFVMTKRDPGEPKDGLALAEHAAERATRGMGRSQRRAFVAKFAASIRRTAGLQSAALGPVPSGTVSRILHDAAARRNLFVRIYQQPNVVPTGWHLFEPFLDEGTVDGLPHARLRPGTRHAFVLEDFLSHLGSSEGGVPADGRAWPETRSAVYEVLGGVGDLVDDGVGGGFAPTGFVATRKGDDVDWILAGGYPLTEDDLADARTEGDRPVVGAVMREEMRTVRTRRGPPMLHPGSRAQSVFFLGRTNLADGTTTRRCRLVEWTELYEVVTEEPEAFGCTDRALEEIADPMRRTIEGLGPIWRLASGMLRLPDYFAFRIDVARDPSAAPAGAVDGMREDSSDARTFSVVPAVRIVGSDGAVGISGSAPRAVPDHAVAVDGYWRPLRSGSIGKDRDGGPVRGRTWVREHRRRPDLPDPPARTKVKTPLSSAPAPRDGAPE